MVIFNTLALLFVLGGLAGFAAGAVLVGPGTGIFLMGAVAAVLDFMYRKKQSAESQYWLFAPTRGGHVFFLPVYIWGGLLALIGIAGGMGGLSSGPSDPREGLLDADEKRMSVNPPEADKTGRTVLSLLKAMVVPEAKPEGMEIFTREKDDRILLLLKVPGLRKFNDTAKRSLAQDTVKLVQKMAPDKKIYLGIKGTLFFGAYVTPTREGVGSFASPEQLWEFYGAKPDPKAPTPASTKPAPGTEKTTASKPAAK